MTSSQSSPVIVTANGCLAAVLTWFARTRRVQVPDAGELTRAHAARENGVSVPMLQIGYTAPPPSAPVLTSAGLAGQGGFQHSFMW